MLIILKYLGPYEAPSYTQTKCFINTTTTCPLIVYCMIKIIQIYILGPCNFRNQKKKIQIIDILSYAIIHVFQP